MRITTRSWKLISFGNAAMLLIGTAMLAQVLGFFRTKLVNANFNSIPGGAQIPPDQNAGVYFAAFVLPDFFFFTIAAGALGVAFMPYLTDRLARGDRKAVWELSSSLINLLSIVLSVVGIFIFIFADVLARQVAHGYTPDQLHNVALMMRILALNPLFFTISGVIAAVQQVFGRFFFYAIAPLFYNLSIIASIYIFKDGIGIVGLAIGAAFGAVLQLAVILLGSYGLGFAWKPKIHATSDFKSMIRQLPPRSLDQGLDQVQSIVETNIASNSALGGATAVGNYNTAYVLHTAPILLIGTAISTAVFPRLNARLSQGRPDLFRQDFLKTLRLIIWITLPVVVVSFFARGYLARLIFSRNSQEIAVIFGALCIAILFRTIFAIVSRWFYAQEDTRTPLLVSMFVIGLNVILAYSLSRPGAYGVEGLAIAQSIVAATEVFILGAIMLNRDRKLFDKEFWSGIYRIVSVTGFSLIAGFIAVQFLPLMTADTGFTLLIKLFAISSITISTHLLISALFGLSEARQLFSSVKRFVLKPVKIEY
ncbi:oligosaccharide flippase family protein [Candidatus Saccharibacteria bacterium]|nr:MAG: oligosaccharide flippase family protein [Candidatus Saccharibacteria bacterium]